ncbi:MAG: diacylglycerol kinase [Puniceicoccales bacterium]|nr:diacylglycerol kinase [Puniceicoccales bacterium]
MRRHSTWDTVKLLLRSLGCFIILITQVIKCSIETVVGLASPRIHPLATRAKDTASASVLLALFNSALMITHCLVN